TLPRIFFISAAEKARSVCVRTLPSLATLNPSAVADTSSGASTIATASYCPSVQNTSFTVAPDFLAMSLKASARWGLSLAFRIPCSVKFASTIKVAIARFSLNSARACLFDHNRARGFRHWARVDRRQLPAGRHHVSVRRRSRRRRHAPARYRRGGRPLVRRPWQRFVRTHRAPRRQGAQLGHRL